MPSPAIAVAPRSGCEGMARSLLFAREDAEALADGGRLLLHGLKTPDVHQRGEHLALVGLLLSGRGLQDFHDLAHELRNLALWDHEITPSDGPRPRTAVGTQYLEELLAHLATGVHAVHAAH